MHLIGVREENGWDISRWELTYRVGWEHIKKGVSTILDLYEHVEVLVDNTSIEGTKDAIMNAEEGRTMVIRGASKILKAPVMIVFYNQLATVDVNVAQVSDEFQNVNYEKFNHSMCQYLDSIELAMYR